MLKTIEFNLEAPELPTRSVTLPKPPAPEELRATASGIGASTSPRTTNTLYTRKQRKARTIKNPSRN